MAMGRYGGTDWDLRAAYEPRGLRWASDYDARRPRLILLQNSSDIQLGGGIC